MVMKFLDNGNNDYILNNYDIDIYLPDYEVLKSLETLRSFCSKQKECYNCPLNHIGCDDDRKPDEWEMQFLVNFTKRENAE